MRPPVSPARLFRSASFSSSRSSSPVRALASSSTRPANFVKIVEVGPRDGLQNESKIVDLQTKLELIDRLGRTGLRSVESGAFVSSKWVPQMATSAEVLQRMSRISGVSYPVLVPNLKGLQNLVSLSEPQQGTSHAPSPSSFLTDEIAIFTAASDSFSKANTNCTVRESLENLSKVAEKALALGLRVRGYVSTVISCPFEGPVAPSRVAEVAKALIDMGCYEVSLGDTVGTGTRETVEAMLDAVTQVVDVGSLAVHNHDTFGMAIANIDVALKYGIRVFDSSVAGLGGCPYSPGATGNVATEDVVHFLHGAGYKTGVDLEALVETGMWISSKLGRRNESRAGVGLAAKWERARQQQQPATATRA